jgi:hypothetical protein
VGKGTFILAVRAIRWAALAACLVVVASFVLFALDQAGGASTVSAAEVAGHSAAYAAQAAQVSKPTPLRRDIDRVSARLTSPFSAFTPGPGSNAWAIRGVQVLLAIAIYGVAIGFAARAVRVRAG